MTTRDLDKLRFTERAQLSARTDSDRIMNFFLAGFFVTGLVLATFYNTWDVALVVGGLSLLAYYSAKRMLPDSTVYQYVLAMVLAVFMAQYIYQMHGMFEMHFIAFIASAMLITYQNWKLQLPLALMVVLHHGVFGYLQYMGVGDIYFTQLDYMSIQTFVIHVFLAAVIFITCGLWSYKFRKYSMKTIEQSYEIGRLAEEKLKQQAIIQSELMVEKANRELQNVLNTISDVIFSVDMTNHKTVHVSAACENVYGYKAEKFYVDHDLMNKAVLPEDRTILEEQYEELHKGRDVNTQYRIKHKDGSIRWIENRIVPTLDEGRRLIRLDGITRDITARRQAEAGVIALNESLERKVKERTEQLEIAVKELEAFSYSVSHDLRSPLRVIHGFSKILMRQNADKLDNDSVENLQAVMDNTKRMAR